MKIQITSNCPANIELQQVGIQPNAIHSVIRPPITLRGFVANDLPLCYVDSNRIPTIPNGWWLSDVNHVAYSYTPGDTKADVMSMQDVSLTLIPANIPFHHGTPSPGWWIWAKDLSTQEYLMRPFVNSYGQIVQTRIPIFVPETIVVSGTTKTLAVEVAQTEVQAALRSADYNDANGLCYPGSSGTTGMPATIGHGETEIYWRWSYLN